MKKLRYFIIAFLLCIAAGTGVYAQNQQLVFERLSTQKWMYQSNITCHTQDTEGYIWFGSSNGLFRFDGYSVKQFNHDPHDANSIAHNNVNTIHAAKDGNLWIGTWGGLNKFDTRTNTFTRYKHDPRNSSSLSNNDVRSIAEDSEGNLWLGTFGGGIVRLNPTSGVFKSFQYSANNASTISSNFVNVIIRDRSGDLWVGTRRGINKLETDNTRFTSFQNLKDGEEEQLVTNISSILEDNKGRIWFGTFGGGLMRLDRRTGKLQSFFHDSKDQQSISSNYINDLSEEENGIIWVEGPSDRTYINHWLKLMDKSLIEGYHYSIMFYGGRLLSNLTFKYQSINEDLIPLLKLNKNSFVIIDRDGKGINSKLNETKQRIKEEIGINKTWITKGREIENYISNNSLNKWLLDEYKISSDSRIALNEKLEETIQRIGKPADKIKYNLNKNKYASDITKHIDITNFETYDLKQNIENLISVIKKWNKI
jgi:streptogramin lyase